MAYDLIIRNGTVIDGALTPPYVADLAVKDGRIVKIGAGLSGADREIDAAGLTVTPGFFDSHAHSDYTILSCPEQKEKAEQGITTVISGMCGGSVAPRPYLPQKPVAAADREDLDTRVYQSVERFMETARTVPQGSNIAFFVGHGNLRRAVLGYEQREATREELDRMKDMLRESLRHGAIGLSFGLFYMPGCFAGAEELTELAQVAAEEGAVVSAHIRDEGDGLIASVSEFIGIIRASGARGVLSHHKASGKVNHGKVRETLRMMDEANAAGADLYCDVYPYTASCTGLDARFVPREFQAGGKTKENLSSPEIRERIKEIDRERDKSRGSSLTWAVISKSTAYPQYIGLDLEEAARLHGKDPYDTVFDIIRDSAESEGRYFTMCEEDVETVLRHPRAMVCTDSGVAVKGQISHPRLVASFPRVLGHYVRERGLVPLPEMIRRITALPAHVYGFPTKGVIREGYDADLCIFDADRIIDKADYGAPALRAEGLRYVIVGGKTAVEDSVFNGTRNGAVLSSFERS